MSQTFYTYLHRRNDTGAVFYIGKGTGRRATNSSNRNIWWRRVVEKTGYSVQILAHWPTDAEACEHEVLLIACFRQMGVALVNLTNGGDGAAGRPCSDEARQKITTAMKARRLSDDHRSRIGEANIRRVWKEESKEKLRTRNFSSSTRAAMSVAKKGRALSPEHRAKMSAAQFARQARERAERGAL